MHERHEILILGPEAAGKTQLVNRLCKKEFNSKHDSTVGIDVLKQNISDTRTISYRDVASDSKKLTFERYFNTSHQIYLVFNAHDDNGLDDLKKYIEQFEFPDTDKIILIGTHADQGITSITENAAKVYASELGGEYYPISSLEENHCNIQSLLSKSGILPTPILQPQTNRRASVDGSSFHDGAPSVIGLSSVALHQHTLRTQGQNIRGHHGNEKRSTKTLSAHNRSGSQAQMSDYN